MLFLETFFIAIGLSMDAFAVAVCKGLGMHRVNWLQAVVIALFFGFFQALMPLIGWLLGYQFEAFITPVDHWIAFILLTALGVKMLWDAVHDEPPSDDEPSGLTSGPVSKLDIKELFVMAIATSIDALAVGITFAFLGVDIWSAILIIGLTTFLLSLVGVVIGNQFGSRFEKPATIAGGIVLIIIGVRILIEHLFF